MSQLTDTYDETQVDPPSTGPQISSLEAAIEALVDIAHEASNFSSFYRAALPVISSCLHFTFVEVELRNAGLIVQEQHSRDSIDPDFWKEITQESLAEAIAEPETRLRVFVGREVQASVALITAPIGNQGRRGGVLAAIVPLHNREQLNKILEEVDVLCTLVSSLADFAHNSPEEVRDETLEELSRTRKVAAFSSETELSYAITNKLRTREGCVQVALASTGGADLKLLSVSGLDDIAHRSPGIKMLRSAMQECVDLGSPVVDQEEGLELEGVATGGRLHRQWRISVGDACVASLPLYAEGQLVAVLSLQRVKKTPFGQEDLDSIREQVEPYAAGLEMVRVARRSLGAHLRHATWSAMKACVAPGRWGRKALVVLSLALGSWSIWGSLPYSISAPCALKPMAGRHIAAASDGVLDAVHVQPGDRVETGQLLCEFDTIELELEASRLSGQLATQEVELYRAMGEGSVAEASLARARRKAVQANLDFVLHRIRSARVVAVADGVILEGDHGSRIGDAFSKGETLFRIAESNEWKLEIHVPERDIDQLKIGAMGHFASHSRPGEHRELEILRLAPTAEQFEGRNVFTAEASCVIPDEWVRAGMEGFASIESGERSPAWHVGHRLVDFMRMNLWL